MTCNFTGGGRTCLRPITTAKVCNIQLPDHWHYFHCFYLINAYPCILYMFRKEVQNLILQVLMLLCCWLVAAGVQCRTRPDELPAPAERRSGATNHYPLPERDNLEPHPRPAPVPECCSVPCVERRDAGAGRVSRLLLGEFYLYSFSFHFKKLY